MGLGPAVAQVGAAEQGPAVELGQAERAPAKQGPAVAQVGAAELGAVAKLGQGPAAELGQGPAVAQVGAAELGAVAELGPEVGQAGPEQGPEPVSESKEGPPHPSQQ